MEANKLQVILNEQDVAKENAKQLLDAFGAPFEEAGKILAEYRTIVVTEEDQLDIMANARSKRLALKDIRVDVEKKRKELKEGSLRIGRAIDSVAKFVKEIIEPAEKYLEEQEKFAEIKQAERAARIKAERVEKLMQYTNDLSMYNLDGMGEEQFESLLNTLKSQHDARLAAEKAAAEVAEQERQAEIKRQKDIEAENVRLKIEAEKREKQLEEERRAEALHQRDLEVQREKERKAEAAKQAKVDAEKEKELAAERAKVEEERKKREEVERSQREKEVAEARNKAAAEQAERDALLAPDRDKLLSFSNALEVIRREKLPAVKTKQAQDVINLIDEMLVKMQDIIVKKSKEI